MRNAWLRVRGPRVRKSFQPLPRRDRHAWLFAPGTPGAIGRICRLACVAVIVGAVGSACSATSQSTVVARGSGPVSSTNNPACLLKPDQIEAVLGSAPAGPSPGQLKIIPGYACFYDKYSKASSSALAIYSLPGISEQEFQEDHFPIPGLFLSVPASVPGLQRTRADGVGSEAFLWNENAQATSAVEFRRGSNVVIVDLMIIPSLGNSYRAAAAIALAKDAASATVS